MNKFDPYQKPPFICPQEYCYNWSIPSYSRDLCCTARECKRLDPNARLDALEPNEQKMASDGLPWFYFTHIDNIVEVMRKKYYDDSEKYWGKS